MRSENEQELVNGVAMEVADSWFKRFEEARANVTDTRPVAQAAGRLLNGSLDVGAEVHRFTGVTPNLSRASEHRPILLVASKFGTWASELTMVAGVLREAGYSVHLASEDGSVPHLLSVSLDPDFEDGAWHIPVVSPEERDLGVRFLDSAAPEHEIFADIIALSTLARPPQVGEYLKNPSSFDGYRSALMSTLHLATKYDAICIAGGSGAIPGLMFDRGLHSLILAFHRLGKPVMGQCNGGLAIVQTIDPSTGRSIVHGRAATTHSSPDEFQSGWGWTLPFDDDPSAFVSGGKLDLAGYSGSERWHQPGVSGNPLIDSEGYFRAALGPEGTFFSPPGTPYAVVADGGLITCRTTPDGYPGALALIATLDGEPPLTSPLFIDADGLGRAQPYSDRRG